MKIIQPDKIGLKIIELTSTASWPLIELKDDKDRNLFLRKQTEAAMNTNS